MTMRLQIDTYLRPSTFALCYFAHDRLIEMLGAGILTVSGVCNMFTANLTSSLAHIFKQYFDIIEISSASVFCNQHLSITGVSKIQPVKTFNPARQALYIVMKQMH